jgi:hypothetical protein
MGKDRQFTGPIFVVGMPRSGTKLLRNILNNHSLIAITPNDSHCIPYFYDNITKYGNLKDFSNFKGFYNDFSTTLFFQRLTQRNDFIDDKSWYEALDDWSYACIVEAFYRLYAQKQNKVIWGDKTPSYLLHLPLLSSLFPKPKFIHIIRDARDYCLSINKTFNKSIYRAAQRWYDSIKKCRQDAKGLSNAEYFEVHYEKLLDSPNQTLQEICHFLDIPYESNMIRLKKPTESKTIDARNSVRILQHNYGKWKKGLAEDSIIKIERICGPLLTELGYPVSYRGEAQRLTQIELMAYKILDGFNIMYSGIKGSNLINAASTVTKSKKHRAVWKAT